jgi:hypothetical protein
VTQLPTAVMMQPYHHPTLTADDSR